MVYSISSVCTHNVTCVAVLCSYSLGGVDVWPAENQTSSLQMYAPFIWIPREKNLQ